MNSGIFIYLYNFQKLSFITDKMGRVKKTDVKSNAQTSCLEALYKIASKGF